LAVAVGRLQFSVFSIPPCDEMLKLVQHDAFVISIKLPLPTFTRCLSQMFPRRLYRVLVARIVISSAVEKSHLERTSPKALTPNPSPAREGSLIPTPIKS
tara:strand:- start:781 stop:1080 length:300 start_codon:yes stop_codon:yes gene_type:complete